MGETQLELVANTLPGCTLIPPSPTSTLSSATAEGEAKQEIAAAVIGESDTDNGVGAIAFQNIIAVPYGASSGAGMHVAGGNTEALGASVGCRLAESSGGLSVYEQPKSIGCTTMASVDSTPKSPHMSSTGSHRRCLVGPVGPSSTGEWSREGIFQNDNNEHRDLPDECTTVVSRKNTIIYHNT